MGKKELTPSASHARFPRSGRALFPRLPADSSLSSMELSSVGGRQWLQSKTPQFCLFSHLPAPLDKYLWSIAVGSALGPVAREPGTTETSTTSPYLQTEKGQRSQRAGWVGLARPLPRTWLCSLAQAPQPTLQSAFESVKGKQSPFQKLWRQEGV